MLIRRIGLALFLIAATQAHAQQTDSLPRMPRAGGRGTIVGIVIDSGGTPVDSVEITVGGLRLRTRTDTAGVFQFSNVKPGTYTLGARRIGFYPQTQKVVLADSGGVVRFTLLPYVRTLAPVISTTSRGGLSGVVGDTAYRVIPNAEIAVLSTDRHTVTDSAGTFFLDLKPGSYALRVTRPGFATRLVSATIPDTGGARMFLWMVPASRGASARDAAIMFELNSRLTRRGPLSKIYTHQDILRLGVTDFSQVARMSGMAMMDDCPVMVDGRVAVPLWTLAPADAEMVEFYPAMRYPGVRRGDEPTVRTTCNAIMYVWLRK